MQEYDHVELLVEKGEYAKYGVHKGMQGWICDPRTIDGTWLVNFPLLGEHSDIETIAIKESDMRVVPGLDAMENERLRVEWGENDPDDLHAVEVTAERKEYACDGVHKGMQGWICFESADRYFVFFPQLDDPGICAKAYLAVDDCNLIHTVTSGVNERILEKWKENIHEGE